MSGGFQSDAGPVISLFGFARYIPSSTEINGSPIVGTSILKPSPFCNEPVTIVVRPILYGLETPTAGLFKRA